MSDTPNEMFLFCDSDKHSDKRLPVVHLVETSPGTWMERGPGGVLFRPGVEFESNGMRGRFSVRPGHSPQFTCRDTRCRRSVQVREAKLNRVLTNHAATGASQISLADLAAKIAGGEKR